MSKGVGGGRVGLRYDDGGQHKPKFSSEAVK